MTVCHIDFETRSTVDIKKTGAYVYAEHPTTDLWCACYAFDDGPIGTWEPGDPCPAAIVDHVLRGGELFAHNANFERVIWKHILTPRYGWPAPAVTQWRCTMVLAYAMALPGALEDAAPAAGIQHRKDAAGHRLMLQMAKPRKVLDRKALEESVALFFGYRGRNGPLTDANSVAKREQWRRAAESALQWWTDPEKRERLLAYCRQDVEVERELAKRLRPLKESELALWHLDQVINDRGVYVDRELAEAAKTVVAKTAEDLDAAMRDVTNFAVTACSNRNQLIAWVREKGVDTESIAKDVVEELLAYRDLPDDVRKALNLRREAAKASVAKINALLRGASPDGRARGLLQFHSASTGRWGGRRFQPQNIVRPDEDFPINEAIDALLGGYADMVFDNGLYMVSQTLRGMVKAAPGRKIIAADYSNIEGRVLAWLAGEQWKMDAFRDYDAGNGPDLYKVAYARSYNMDPRDVTKPQRQIGKVMELALGYQGGVGAFKTMGINYGVDLPDNEVEQIRDQWRGAHPNIRSFWWELENAAIDAVAEPGVVTSVRDIRFKVAGSFLWMRLPSGRFLAYAYPEMRPKEMPWVDDETGKPVIKNSLSYMGTNTYTRKWERCFAYGGLLAENATQAVARDILADAMPRLEAAGYPIILHVHDEAVTEPEIGHGSVGEMVSIMTDLPAWADGCPVAAEGWEGERYRK